MPASFEVHGGPITHRYLMNKSKSDLASMYMELLDVYSPIRDERDCLLAALDPNETKAAYIGEVKDDIHYFDENGDERWGKHTISWTAMKEFMTLIRKRAGVE